MIVNDDFQVNHMQLRYKFKNGWYIPEYYHKNEEKYSGFLDTEIDNNIKEFVEHMAQIEKRNYKVMFFGNTKELFFKTELCCLAFLGAARSYYESTIVNYKQLKLKQINK